ncbi:putative odorant receptor 83c [Pseudolycoriella hygida]|uniref:Odorant receptor 83c n=1 Tax=Pseudolycoriella hygida TaxID=35572 RepID=A0A9Q0NG69_9DIPT|nr:putative odorant receptor 83c [Pseudolycoriella hygida]
MDVLRSLSLCPIAVQCVVKLTTFFSNTKLIKELNIVNLDLCGNTTGIWQDCLYVWFHKFEQISTLHVSVHWFGATLLLCYPLYGYFVLGEMVPFFDVVIPFVDDTTARGYIVTLLFQFVLCVFVISIMYNVDYLFLLTLFSGAAFIDLVEEDCKALSFTIVNSKREVNVSGIRDRLISAIRRNQGMRRYLKKTCAIFENGCLIQLYCGGFTLCVCLFVAKMSDWFPIYFIGIAALYQMSLYCLLGTMIEWKSNQLSKVVYDVPWNKLNVNNQKVFRYFLQMSQSTIKVTLMGSLTLNIQTGMAVGCM